MRLFVAVDVGDPVRLRAAQLIAELQQRIDDSRAAKLTWVTPGRMHLTVRFIGEVEEPQADQIGRCLARPIPMDPFIVTWQGLMAFPTPRRPRVLACRVGAGGDELRELEQLVGERLREAGLDPDRRAYTPHLTLARIRELGQLKPAALLARLEDATLGDSCIDAITLLLSRLSPTGPSHRSLLRTPLARS